MDVTELDREQLQQLKVAIYAERNGGSISYGEIASIDELVTDSEATEQFAGYVFSPDDFS